MESYRPRSNLPSTDPAARRRATLGFLGGGALLVLLLGLASRNAKGAEGQAPLDAGPVAGSPEASSLPGADRGASAGAEAQAEQGDEGISEEESSAAAPGRGKAAELPEASEALGQVLRSLGQSVSLKAEEDLLARSRPVGTRWSVDFPHGARTLTIEPKLQQRAVELLRSYAVPYGAVVAIEPSSGRVLALAEFSAEAPGKRGFALKALYPAASIFKLVTGAALLEAGVSPAERVCYHGGKRRLDAKVLKDDPRRDGRCITLSDAMGQSANVVFAKLAQRKLDAETLLASAARFGFNARIPFAEPLEASPARIPEDAFGLAATAAGFGEVLLSPVHGALLAATVANGGRLPMPLLFEDEARQSRPVLDPATAEALADMMETTVTEGTARKAFRERGRPVLGTVRAAGKTGSLADQKPFRDYSWFVGFAPRQAPTIAVAVVVVNGTLWRVRAPYLAREVMRAHLEPPRSAERARRGSGGRAVRL